MARITGIPLSYVIRYSVAPVPDPTALILNQYFCMTPHHGIVYQGDNRNLFNISSTLIKDSRVGNTNVKIFLAQSDGQVLVTEIYTHIGDKES